MVHAGIAGRNCRGWRILRAGATIGVVVLCIVLPYRWLWAPCALAASLLVGRGPSRTIDVVRRHATLIYGTTVVLLLQTALDPLWWMPWIVSIAALCALRPWIARVRRRATAALVVIWTMAFIMLGRPWEGFWAGRSAQTVPSSAILICAGDSLTAGLNRTDADTYVARLRDRLGCRVLNAGVANDRTGDLLARVDRDVVGRTPSAVLIFIGGNDYLDGTPRATFASDLDAVVQRITACGARVALVEVPTGIVWNPYAGIYRRTAARYGARLIPESMLRVWFTVELLARDHLSEPMTLDGIHLSPSGATRVAGWLEPYLRSLIAGDPAPRE